MLLSQNAPNHPILLEKVLWHFQLIPVFTCAASVMSQFEATMCLTHDWVKEAILMNLPCFAGTYRQLALMLWVCLGVW
jgi:hypothetical protein